MKQIRIVSLFVLLTFVAIGLRQGANIAAAASAPQTQPSQPSPPTLASAVDRDITAVEKQIVEVAEAMPEDKYNFSPESLKIPGSDFKGVRTFAVQVKHVAASNYFIWSPITGDKVPESIKDGNGPQNLKSKAEIIQFLKESFALGHKAAALLTTENMLQSASIGARIHPFGSGGIRRLPCFKSLRTDGRVLADERNCAARQPGKVRLIANPAV